MNLASLLVASDEIIRHRIGIESVGVVDFAADWFCVGTKGSDPSVYALLYMRERRSRLRS